MWHDSTNLSTKRLLQLTFLTESMVWYKDFCLFNEILECNFSLSRLIFKPLAILQKKKKDIMWDGTGTIDIVKSFGYKFSEVLIVDFKFYVPRTPLLTSSKQGVRQGSFIQNILYILSEIIFFSVDSEFINK